MPPKNKSKRLRVSEPTNLEPEDVHCHLETTYAAFSEFYKNLRISDKVTVLASRSSSLKKVDSSSEVLSRWLDTTSIPYCIRTVEPKNLNHLINETVIKKPPTLGQTAEQPARLEKIKFLESMQISYRHGIKTNEFIDGVNIRAFIEKLITGQPRTTTKTTKTTKESKNIKENGAMMFCGGPVSALAICPQCDDSSEILAVSTFADEINLFLPDSPSNYIQLWTFDPALKSNPECSVLLETPRCTVLALSWCPVLVDHPDKCLKSRKKNDRCLGLLAAATDKGVVFIYSIPHQLSGMRDLKNNRPTIFRISPVATLVYSSPYDCIPIGSLEWSAYNGGAQLIGVSDSSQILLWDLEKENEEPFQDPDGHLPHIQGIKSVRPSVINFNDVQWDAPAIDAVLVDKDKLAVVLRSRVLHIYSVPTMEVIATEKRSRLTGLILKHVPQLYSGLFCFDSTLASIDSIPYSTASYLTHEDDVLVSLPLFNRHQLQISDAAISLRSGIVATVGMDGRLVNTLNSRITVKNDEEGDRTFQYGRPHLHLVRLRKEVEKENHVPVLRKHEECQQNSWLEIRAGDAALLDMNSARKHKTLSPDPILDRRTEALTRISASTLTDGLFAVGGEAGLIFLLPALL